MFHSKKAAVQVARKVSPEALLNRDYAYGSVGVESFVRWSSAGVCVCEREVLWSPVMVN
jgi:hypothetical protein